MTTNVPPTCRHQAAAPPRDASTIITPASQPRNEADVTATPGRHPIGEVTGLALQVDPGLQDSDFPTPGSGSLGRQGDHESLHPSTTPPHRRLARKIQRPATEQTESHPGANAPTVDVRTVTANRSRAATIKHP
jgi:hypothetical protein